MGREIFKGLEANRGGKTRHSNKFYICKLSSYATQRLYTGRLYQVDEHSMLHTVTLVHGAGITSAFSFVLKLFRDGALKSSYPLCLTHKPPRNGMGDKGQG